MFIFTEGTKRATELGEKRMFSASGNIGEGFLGEFLSNDN